MGSNIADIRAQTAGITEQMREAAANGSFLAFAHYVNNQYQASWHHAKIIREIQGFLSDPDRKRLMLFVPPQHGKSEIASRLGPAFALGLDPNLSIAACSYSADLARKFNREVQRIMDSEEYLSVFPKSSLNQQRVSNDHRGATLRNTQEFEVVGYRGNYKAVGIGGGLSGRRVDLAIIDDPVKDAAQAYSSTIRENVWDWYLSVLNARLHNKSKVLLIMTRWHEDDLAGRLLKHYPNEWEVISLPAVKEDGGHEWDKRKVGEALWPERHSLDRLLEIERVSPMWFAGLYQQRPTPKGGGLIKGEWFGRVRADQIPPGPINFYVDTAYTEKQQNDPSAIIAYKVFNGKMYVLHCTSVRKSFPQFIEWLPEYCKAIGYTNHSTIRIEPKASGISIAQQLQYSTSLNVVLAPAPTTDKVARIGAIGPILSSGRVMFVDVQGGWVGETIAEYESFPNGLNDDRVDVLEGAVRCELVNELANSIRKTN